MSAAERTAALARHSSLGATRMMPIGTHSCKVVLLLHTVVHACAAGSCLAKADLFCLHVHLSALLLRRYCNDFDNRSRNGS